MNNCEFKNVAELRVNACGENHIVYSNEVAVEKIDLRVEKCANKSCVFSGDCLEYSIKICNDSNCDIINPIFCDFLPIGIVLEPETFKYNHVHYNPTYTTFDNKVSYMINKLDAGCEATITFSTKVL